VVTYRLANIAIDRLDAHNPGVVAVIVSISIPPGVDMPILVNNALTHDPCMRTTGAVFLVPPVLAVIVVAIRQGKCGTEGKYTCNQKSGQFHGQSPCQALDAGDYSSNGSLNEY
jgi:hypothetical protein